MSLDIWFSFVLVALVAVVSPGPAVLLTVTHAGQYGVRRALVPILGNITGLGLLAIASAVGVGSLLTASSEWFMALRIVGGLYLVYLGIKLLRSPSVVQGVDTHGGQSLRTAPSHWKAYLQGVMIALSNPKALLFIGALFPQFLDVSRPVWGQLAILGLTLMTMSFSALVVYATLSSTLLSRGRKALYGKINKVTGVLFILFGTVLAVGNR
jgi:threonine/homoserine/homoserine lactone efflux protein